MGISITTIPAMLLALVYAATAPVERQPLAPTATAARSAPAAYDWNWLGAHRASVLDRSAPVTLENNAGFYWPTETVSGGNAPLLPRRADRCLTSDRLQPALEEARRTNSSSLIVWHNGAVVLEEHQPGAADRHPEAASMHKTVLALAIGQAISDGAIPGLDVPVKRWLTEWTDDPRGLITVRQLLQMTSGLDPAQSPAAMQNALFGSDFTSAALATPLKDAPGSRFNYMGTASQLLALFLERATGERYAKFLSRRLWRDVGAADAYVALDRPDGLARASASLMARPEDWLRIGVLIGNKGKWRGKQLVRPEWIAAMAAPSPANPNYGLHLWLAGPWQAFRRYNEASPAGVKAATPFAFTDMVYLDGSVGQRVYVSPSSQIVIVRLGANAKDWDDSLLPNLVAEALVTCNRR